MSQANRSRSPKTTEKQLPKAPNGTRTTSSQDADGEEGDCIEISIPQRLLPRRGSPLAVTIWNCYEIVGWPPRIFRALAKKGKFPVLPESNGRWPMAPYQAVKDYIDKGAQVLVRPGEGASDEDVVAMFKRSGGRVKDVNDNK